MDSAVAQISMSELEIHMTKNPIAELDPEIAAIGEVFAALKGLESEAQSRVLLYVAQKLKIEGATLVTETSSKRSDEDQREEAADERGAQTKQEAQDELEGVSPPGKKWMTRSGFRATALSKVFSLSDEIDLIAETVPGESNRQRVRSVFLLKGMAAYLASGAARFSHEQIKEACLHYDAYDATNFSTYVKSISSEVSGTKDTGYTLTPRGINSATEMVKKMINPGQAA